MLRLALALLLALPPGAAAANACGSTADCLAAIEKAQRDTASFTADFVQVKHLSLLDEPLVSRGRLSFRRPDRMRLEIREPVQALVLIDGRQVHIPGVSKKDAEAMSMAPVAGMFTQLGAIFSGDRAALERGFEVEASARGDAIDVALVPRDERGRRLFRRIDLQFSGAALLAHRIRLEDGLGDHLEVTLDDVRRNVELPDALFRPAPEAAPRSE